MVDVPKPGPSGLAYLEEEDEAEAEADDGGDETEQVRCG
jgi:hypothetical protein